MTLKLPLLKQCFLRTIKVLAVMLSLGGVFQCRETNQGESEEHQIARELVQEWNRMALELERYTPGYRPPITSRMFAYLGMAAYEASLPDLTDYVSLEWYCDGYKAPAFSENDYWLPAGLNAAYAESLRFFFPEAPMELKKSIDQLEDKWTQHGKSSAETLQKSILFGRESARAVMVWSATDTLGHQGYLYNYDRNYHPPEGAGKWKPGGVHPMPALLPYWGKARRFATWTDPISVLPPITYDSIPGSPYHTEALEVFTISQNLSKESHWIAEFWSDDIEGLTLTPSGRWIKITNQAVEKSVVPFTVVLETYLMIGWALNDAAVTCWTGKYGYNVQRPEDYIHTNIHPGWKPLHDSPSFPAYPSGHSAFGAAVAEILTVQLGDNFSITDRTHVRRQEFAGKPRTYKSFKAMALENAASRLYLGVHFRMDCTEGLRIGKKVGQNLLSIRLKKDELAVK